MADVTNLKDGDSGTVDYHWVDGFLRTGPNDGTFSFWKYRSSDHTAILWCRGYGLFKDILPYPHRVDLTNSDWRDLYINP